MLGATELSNIAERLELASNEENTEAIYDEHETMMELYKKITDVLVSVLDSSPQSSNESGNNIDDDDEILEFLPE